MGVIAELTAYSLKREPGHMTEVRCLNAVSMETVGEGGERELSADVTLSLGPVSRHCPVSATS